MSGAHQLTYIPVTAFSQTDYYYFWFEFISNSDPHWNLSDQLQSQAWNNVGMSTCSREAALFCPHRSVHMQTGTGLFRGENI